MIRETNRNDEKLDEINRNGQERRNELNRDKMKENEEKRGEARRRKKSTKHEQYPLASVDRSELSGRVVRWPAGNAPSTSPSSVLRASPPGYFVL